MSTSSVKPSLGLWIKISVFVILIVLLYPSVLHLFIDKDSEKGLLGDSFGLLNTLFTGLAFSGVIITILMQRHELIKQRIDNEKSRLEEKKQRFEKSIFMLINLHLDIIDKLEFLSKRKRDVFIAYNETIVASASELETFVTLRKLTPSELSIFASLKSDDEVKAEFSESTYFSLQDVNILSEIKKNGDTAILDSFQSKDHDVHIAILKKAIKKSQKLHRDVLAHYFRNLYNIIKTIDNASFLSDDEKTKFVNLVRTQISNEEMISIFYNSIVEIDEGTTGMKPLGYPKMTRFIKKYKLLKHLGNYSYFHEIHGEIFVKSCERAGVL